MTDDQRLQRKLIERNVSTGSKIFRRGTRLCARVKKRQHAVEKTLPPRRIEPSIEIRCREMVRRERKLPIAGWIAAVEGTAPARSEGLRGRDSDMASTRLPFRPGSYLIHGPVQEWRTQRIATSTRARSRTRATEFDPANWLAIGAAGPRIRGLPPAEIAGKGTREIPTARKIPSERGRSRNQIAGLAGGHGKMPPGNCAPCRLRRVIQPKQAAGWTRRGTP